MGQETKDRGRSWTVATARFEGVAMAVVYTPCLHKLSSIRSFRFPVGCSCSHTHTSVSWAEIKRGIYSVSALCETGKLGRDSRGKVVASWPTDSLSRGIRIRRQEKGRGGGMEIFWPSSQPAPPPCRVQIRSDLRIKID